MAIGWWVKEWTQRVGHHLCLRHVLWWLSVNVRYLLLYSRRVVWTIWEKVLEMSTLGCKEMSTLCFVLDFTLLNWYCILEIQFLQIFSMGWWYWVGGNNVFVEGCELIHYVHENEELKLKLGSLMEEAKANAKEIA